MTINVFVIESFNFIQLLISCASLLLTNNIPMKMIQEWLGHSDISTTSNIYAHLDAKSKNLSAKTIEAALQII